MNRGLVSSLLSEASLLIHVCPANQLDAKIVSHPPRGLYLEGHLSDHPFQVLLEPIHYNRFIASVESVSQLVRDRVEASLHIGLLCVYVKKTITLMG